MDHSANEILPWSQIGAKLGLGARNYFWEPDDFPWSQISGIWLPWSQLGNPGRKEGTQGNMSSIRTNARLRSKTYTIHTYNLYYIIQEYTAHLRAVEYAVVIVSISSL